ncbi:MAG: adenine phosphoribosyltransferase [Deltaproteobacteria bacterium]|nr:adenine phosphoribosyltransferase [Deltaproteobacteria bacterium]
MTAVLREKIRAVPDFPRKGILFRDITPLLADGPHFRSMVDVFVDRYRGKKIDKIVAIESRGYLIGAPLAYALGAGLIIVRKPGKLPAEVDRESYALEYGTDSLEMHTDALAQGERVIIVDDLLATGGTAEAAGRLVSRRGATLLEYAFLVELTGLPGKARLGADKVFAVLDY